MGDIADWLEEIDTGREEERMSGSSAGTVTYWTMKNGNRINIVDMDDRHLFNTIRMLKRKPDPYRYEGYLELTSELLRRKALKNSQLPQYMLGDTFQISEGSMNSNWSQEIQVTDVNAEELPEDDLNLEQELDNLTAMYEGGYGEYDR